MKIHCPCGELVVDQTDALPSKAHVIPDQDFFRLLDAIDEAVEQSGPAPTEREAACMRVRRLVTEITRRAWQCRACGRLFVDRGRSLQVFVPEGDDPEREIFRVRPDP